ncbi:MAG: MDR family MFS transporter [Microbacteriaceae bacterium]
MSRRQINLVVVGLMAGMFLSALDQTIVGTSMRTIADDLNGLSLQAWVTTAYLITATIMTPIYGKLSDIFGRRPLFIFAITVFLLGSLLAGMSQSMEMLAAFRALQGVGAGGLMALPLATMGDMLSPRERAKYQGYFLAVFGVSSVIGPLIGGLFAGADQILWVAGWRWVFLVNLPIGVVALAIVLRFLHLPKFHSDHKVRIDWFGAAFVIMALVPLLLVAENGREWGWDSPAAIWSYVVGGVGVVAFILTEWRMRDDAIIPLKLFKSRVFSMATVIGVFVGFGMFGGMLVIPLYLQLVQGATPTESGLLMLPMIAGMMTGAIVSGQVISRTGKYRVFPISGTFFMALGYFWLTFEELSTPLWWVMVGMFFIGLGLGQLMQTLTIASQNSVSGKDMGVATSASTFFRQIGGTLGTAVLFSVLFSRIPDTIAAAFKDDTLMGNLVAATKDPAVIADPKNEGILQLLQTAQSGGDTSGLTDALNGNSSFLTGADSALSAPFLTGFVDASITVFWVAFAVVSVAFVLSLFFKPAPLRDVSAMQERHDEARAEAKLAAMG